MQTQTTLTNNERRQLIRLTRQIGKQQTVFKLFLAELEKKMTQGLRILILDDDELRHAAFSKQLIGNVVVHVATAGEAIANLENNALYDVIFLDHDLGGSQMVESGPGTGYEVAQWLEAHPDKQPRTIILHTFNPVGAKNMRACLPGAQWLPGIWAKESE